MLTFSPDIKRFSAGDRVYFDQRSERRLLLMKAVAGAGFDPVADLLLGMIKRVISGQIGDPALVSRDVV